jgi:hypothetical protein
MVKPVVAPEDQSHIIARVPDSARYMQETPVEELVETLRTEFSRGLLLEAERAKTARRRRITVLIVSLAALAGAVITAAFVEITTHRSP